MSFAGRLKASDLKTLSAIQGIFLSECSSKVDVPFFRMAWKDVMLSFIVEMPFAFVDSAFVPRSFAGASFLW